MAVAVVEPALAVPVVVPRARSRGVPELARARLAIDDEARSVRPSYYFMMRSLLRSRVDTGLASNQDLEDEDVNVYLAHLLQAFSDPQYLESSQPYLHRYDHEVFGRLSSSTDSRL